MIIDCKNDDVLHSNIKNIPSKAQFNLQLLYKRNDTKNEGQYTENMDTNN